MTSLALSILSLNLFANMGPQGFSEYLNSYFVETGSFFGDSIQKALDVGFSEVRSIEYLEDSYQHCRQRFQGKDEVKLFKGSSTEKLWEMIKDIDQPITFWLDAHIYPPIKKKPPQNCPLIAELEQIRQHPIKTHTILIDDMHCCNTLAFDYLTKDDLIRKIREINPAYEISFVPGGDAGEFPNNVMVAKVIHK